jgi:hypothetical protein
MGSTNRAGPKDAIAGLQVASQTRQPSLTIHFTSADGVRQLFGSRLAAAGVRTGHKEREMPKITVVFGLLLCGLTLATLIVTREIGSITIFIPTMVGLPLVLLGLGAILKPHLRKHLMHVAVTIGLLGALAALGRGIPQALKIMRGEVVDWLPVSMVWAMILICVTYVFVCVESFISARRARQAAESSPSTPSRNG